MVRKVPYHHVQAVDANVMKHTAMWLDEKNQHKVLYRDVHMNTLSNEVESIPPVARVY